jgi:hypothetical protein
MATRLVSIASEHDSLTAAIVTMAAQALPALIILTE